MERKLTAILSADVKGYSRLMGEDEEATIRTLTAYRQVITTLIQQHRGRVVDSPGDNLLAEFASAVDAVRCAIEIQRELQVRNGDLPAQRKMEFRIGINVGDVVVEGEKLYGDGVNIAARLEGLAEPGGVCISGTVHDQVENKLGLSYEYVGEQAVKNIAKPVRVWRVRIEPKASIPTVSSQGETSSPLPLPDKPSVAVLPFTNMSGDAEQEYFSDGMTEDLITDLSKLSGLFVIARHSVFTYKGKAVKVAEVSKELGVRYVLEGSVRKAGNRVRITAQLVDAITGHHLWAERYDRELKDIFALQDEITRQIVAALRIELREAELARVRRIPTNNLTAYDSLLRGEEYLLRFTREADVQARQLFEHAIALDPEYAEAYVALGALYWREWGWWNQNPQALERAFELVQKAVLLDDSLPQVHGLLGWVYLWRKQPELALLEGEQAIALDPNDADTYISQAQTLTFLERPAEALELVEKAMRLNPRCPAWYLGALGMAYRRMGRHEEAVVALKQALLRSPNLLIAYCELAEAYLAQWDSLQTQDSQILERALESAQKAVAMSDSLSWGHSLLARVYLWKRQHAQALAEGERAIVLEPDEAHNYALLAAILSYAGQPEKAIEVMEQALRMNPHPPAWYYVNLGQAYLLTGRVEEANSAFKRVLTCNPDFLSAHVFLAAIYSGSGQEAEARAELAEVLRISPNFSLEVIRQMAPVNDQEGLERFLDLLRKAGLT
ncbi:MAG TPA: tetratricopeptide repeat protein [Candidatus Binatia bacterium]|jgi:adenylate cyclase|nr:tetratricopeptide repeat protein [Candidatus Binatia bacterium]